jgi:hypothetical protein
LQKAMTGTAFTNVEKVCHANFSSLASTDCVGALMIRLPIDTDNW